MVCHKYKFIFNHVPKAGGTSIMEGLRPLGLTGEGHLRQSQMIEEYELTEEQYKEYTKFAIVRNPWSWVFSNYNYIKMKKSYWHSDDGSTRYGVHVDYNKVKDTTFSEFIYLLKDKKIKHKCHSLPQSYWLDEELDYILKLENLDKDFPALCKKMGIKEKISLPYLNKSSDLDYRDFYNEELIDLVRDLYEEDVNRFGYSFS